MSALCDTVADCADGSDEAAARCEDTEPRVRLVAGNNVTSGRLEVRHHGVWGSGEMNISLYNEVSRQSEISIRKTLIFT